MLNMNNIVTSLSFGLSIFGINLPEEIVSASSLSMFKFKLRLKKFDLHA